MCCSKTRTSTRRLISLTWIMTLCFWRSPTFQSSLKGDGAGSLTPAIQGQCGRQAGRQLYYSSGTAGSAEGEALTPILMRLHCAVTEHRGGPATNSRTATEQRFALKPNPLFHSEKRLNSLKFEMLLLYSITFAALCRYYSVVAMH